MAAPNTLWAMQGKDVEFGAITADSFAGAVQNTVAVASADGAISLKAGVVVITKGSAAALTLAAPVSGTDNGKVLTIVSTTDFAHTVTSPGFNGDGTSGDVATFTNTAGCAFQCVAYNGVWYTFNLQGVSLA